MANIVEDGSLSEVERIRLRQKLVNERLLGAAAEDERGADSKVRMLRQSM